MNTQIKPEQVYERLKIVIDPELHIDIVSLGLIYEVKIKKLAKGRELAHVVMTLTTPGCPLAPVIDRMIKEALEPLGVEVKLELEWDPPWVKEMMSEEARLKLGIL